MPSSGRSSPAFSRAGGLVGLEQRALGEHLAEGVELGVEALDARQVRLDELARGDLAGAQQLGLARGAGEGQVGRRPCFRNSMRRMDAGADHRASSAPIARPRPVHGRRAAGGARAARTRAARRRAPAAHRDVLGPPAVAGDLARCTRCSGSPASVVSVDAPGGRARASPAVAALSALGELTGRVRVLALLWPRRATQNVVSARARRAGAGEAHRHRAVRRRRAPRPARRASLGGLDARLRRALRRPLARAARRCSTLALARHRRLRRARASAGVEADVARRRPARPDRRLHRRDGAARRPRARAAVAGRERQRAAPPPWRSRSSRRSTRGPPRRLDVELVLAGAGDGPALGMRRVRPRAPQGRDGRARSPSCASSRAAPATPRFWTPRRPAARHPACTRGSSSSPREAGGVPHRGRGVTGALRARQAGWPAVAIGCLDDRGRAPARPRAPTTRRSTSTSAALALRRARARRSTSLDARLDADPAQPARPARRAVDSTTAGGPPMHPPE